jgi:DNA primase
MPQDLQALKQRIPLLDYLRRHDWTARPVGTHQEFVGLCPLHPETHPSFYVNAAKNVFYCHGCGRGGDLIRFVQLLLNLSFREALVHLKQHLGLPEPGEDEALREAVDFYQQQLGCHTEGVDYLHGRGVHDAKLIEQLSIGYAPGGMLYRHMSRLGYPTDLLMQLGLIHQGKDAFYHRIVFPCFDGSRPVNLYGRSMGGAARHRFLPRPKGGLFAWSTVRNYPHVILAEGLFDVAVLWQAGFVNTSCAFGVHLTDTQVSQLSDRLDRTVFIAFDSDLAGQNAARTLAQRLQSSTGVNVRIVDLPAGQDQNSYFVGGASAAEFDSRLRNARCP